MGILANENSISAGGYTIERSLRFQAASSQSLSRTPSSSGSQTTYTYSAWVKRGILSSSNYLVLWSSESSGANYTSLVYYADAFYWATNGTVLQSTAVYRDTSAWYHIVLAVDTTQATSTNRVKIYVNGSQVSLTGSYPTLNQALQINTASFVHKIGFGLGFGQYFDGYMAEFQFIDGQVLTPSSFGETDALTGVWVAKKYTGTYGTNGFYLKFNDGTSTTTLGTDSSGNANNWTLTNFTRSAGVSDCWMYDVPSGNGGVSATQPSSNYCVLNPVYANTQGIGTISRGNLNFSFGNATTQAAVGTFSATSGKWYWEVIASANPVLVGVRQINTNDRFSNSILWGGSSISASGEKWVNGTQSAFAGISYTTGDVVGVAVDMDGGNVSFYKNNTLVGTLALSLATITEFVPAFNNGASTAFAGNANFGQRSFAYTPPSGFKALCTANLPAPTIAKGNQYMDATLYSGTGGSQSITNAGAFSPDLVWTKARSQADQNNLMDTVRGVANRLFSNLTNAETTGGLVSVNSNGFSIDATSASMNNSGQTYVAWQWDAGSSTVTNTSGTISSQVRANTTAGFSIVTYTGTGANATVGHGLGVAPKMVIVKNRDQTGDWCVYHVNMNATPQNYYMQLNLTGAAGANSTIWNNTAPTSTTFSIGSYLYGNGIKYVAYCFAEISGFSKVFSYAGNGSTDGTFVYTGFRPKFIMIKEASGTNAASASWQILDTSRNPSNVSNTMLYPNLSGAEGTGDNVDILSNGFKIRASGYFVNESGGTYIGIAFAENPFNYSNAR